MPKLIRRYDPETVKRARELRNHATATEQAVWELLRGRRMLGLKFRRQQPMRGFILDFYCPGQRIAIEVDGRVHSGSAQRTRDLERDASLERLGVRVIRMANDEATPAEIERRLRALVGSPPLPQGEGVGGRGWARKGEPGDRRMHPRKA